MKNKKLEANLSMAVSKIFSGLNMNALKYLLPLWMSPLTGDYKHQATGCRYHRE